MLTSQDKIECKEIAREIVQEVLKIHVQICPHGRKMFRMIWVSIGIAVGSGITSGGVVLAIVKALGL